MLIFVNSFKHGQVQITFFWAANKTVLHKKTLQKQKTSLQLCALAIQTVVWHSIMDCLFHPPLPPTVMFMCKDAATLSNEYSCNTCEDILACHANCIKIQPLLIHSRLHKRYAVTELHPYYISSVTDSFGIPQSCHYEERQKMSPNG